MGTCPATSAAAAKGDDGAGHRGQNRDHQPLGARAETERLHEQRTIFSAIEIAAWINPFLFRARRLDRRLSNGRQRRIFLVAAASSEGLLTEPTADAQPLGRNWSFCPKADLRVCAGLALLSSSLCRRFRPFPVHGLTAGAGSTSPVIFAPTGHRVIPATLTGLGERAHLSSPEAAALPRAFIHTTQSDLYRRPDSARA